MKTFDIVINGGGIAGLTLALALQDSGLSIAVIEGTPAVKPLGGLAQGVADVTPRVSALTVESQVNLQRWGAWQFIDAQRFGEYSAMHVWDAQGNAAVDFAAHEVRQESLGCIIENAQLVDALRRAIQALHTQVVFFQPCKLADIQKNDKQPWQLRLDDERELDARLLIAADGANSFVRQHLSLPTREWDYAHHAIVATVETHEHHQDTAWQRFLPSGPLAFLPLKSAQGKLCSIVWSVLPDKAQALLDLSDEDFLRELDVAFESRLGGVVSITRRYSFPLRQRHAKHYVEDRLALIADAAHTIHPLAGQGINLGLQDVAVLAQEIMNAQKKNIDWSSKNVLLRYQRRRKVHNLGMMAVVEGFARLFGSENLHVTWLRNEGMRLFSKIEPLKKQIIKRAIGL